MASEEEEYPILFEGLLDKKDGVAETKTEYIDDVCGDGEGNIDVLAFFDELDLDKPMPAFRNRAQFIGVVKAIAFEFIKDGLQIDLSGGGSDLGVELRLDDPTTNDAVVVSDSSVSVSASGKLGSDIDVDITFD